jgi:hypothetical protein
MEPLYITEKSFYLQFFNITSIADFTMLKARPTSPREFLISLNEALPLAVLPHNLSMQFSSQVTLVIN